MGSYSSDWWIGIGAAWFVQLFIVIVADTIITDGTLLQWLGVAWMVGWVAMPFFVYLDLYHMREVSPWKPRIRLYTVLSAIPAFNLVFGALYLFQRHEIGLRSDHGFTGKEAAVSDDWWGYIVVSLLFLATTLAIPYRYLAPHVIVPITVPGMILWIALLGATFGMGIAVAYDRAYLSTVSSWTPSRLYILFAMIPPVNIMTGLYYLGIRHMVLGKHRSETDDTEAEEE